VAEQVPFISSLRTGETKHDQIIDELVEQEEYYRKILTTPFNQITDFWKIYFGDREDLRLPWEKKWRPNIHTPRPYSSVETMVASVADIIESIDPLIQPEGIGLEDEPDADNISRALSYCTNRMRFPTALDVSLREMGVQGTSFRKSVWANKVTRIFFEPDDKDRNDFNEAILLAIQKGAPPPPFPDEDPEAFDMWRELVLEAGYGSVPPAPVPGFRDVVRYRGPAWAHVHIGDLRFDPMIAHIQAQHRVYHRMVKPNSWIRARAGKDENQGFDPEQVESAISKDSTGDGEGGNDHRLNEWQQEQAALMGINMSPDEDPLFANKSELWEVYEPGSRLPYKVVLNRKAIINKTPWKMPFEHQEVPIQAIRNVLVPGQLLGLTEFKQCLPLFEELDKLRNLRLEAVTLAVLPILLRQQGVGIPDSMKQLRPGYFYTVSNMKGYGSLNEHIKVPEAIFRELPDLVAEIDETLATQDVVRGGSAPYSRTTATEVTRRLERALTRQKQRVKRVSGEISEAVPQWLSLCAQYAPDDWKIHVSGSKSPWIKYGRNDFRDAIEKDYRFRGAENSLNRELKAQMLMDFFSHATSGRIPALAPHEGRAALKRAWAALGEKGGSTVFTQEGEQYVTALSQAMLAPPEPQGEGEQDQVA
jgi:hypothetical protein